ncbi:MAG: replicative DNA helicase [Parvibaculaceae bacterium]
MTENVYQFPDPETLPKNIEAEQALLGAILVNNDAHNLVASFLRPEHFSEAIHARIFEAVVALRAKGRLASPETLKLYFQQDETLKEIGGTVYLARLARAATTIINAGEYGRLVYENAQRRSLIKICLDTANNATQPAVDSTLRDELAGHIEECQNIFDGSTPDRKSVSTLPEAGRSSLKLLNLVRAGNGDPNAIPTGVPGIDRLTGGMRRGEFIVLGARPSVGKTAFAVQIAQNVGANGDGVAFFSLEMPTAILVPRFISSSLFTPSVRTPSYQQILRGDVLTSDMPAIEAVVKGFDEMPIIIDDAPGLSAVEVEARARVMASKFQAAGKRLGLVIVDHIHRMRGPSNQNRVAQFSEISSGLAEAAKRLDAPLLCLAQLNRSLESREEKRPTLADLRESGAIEQDADLVLFLYRDSYYLKRQPRGKTVFADMATDRALEAANDRLELIIAKQRSGPVDVVHLFADMATNAIRDLSEVSA